MRVGIIALQHESNTFLPTPTTLAQFRADTLLTGPAIADKFRQSHHEIGGFFQGLEQAGIDACPLLAAIAVPSGVIDAETERALIALIDEQLDAAGPFDGLLVAPHGAAVGATEPDFDGHWLSRLRATMGAAVPIVCTLDLHANVSARMIAACDATIAYRSNPHLDQRERGLQAAGILVRTLRGEIRPTQALATPPVAINIERQQTASSPCLDLLAYADRQLETAGVLSNSVVLGFPYADVAEMGTSFIVVSDGDRGLAQTLVAQLADYLLAKRADFVAELIGVDDAIARACKLQGPVCLLDMGDNVGGGSAADSTWIAAALHERGAQSAGANMRSFVSLYDPQSVDACRQHHSGARLQLSMGGKTDALHGPPFNAPVILRGLYDGRFREPAVRHGGRGDYDMGKTAIVETDSGITIQLTAKRVPPFSLGQLSSCGLDARDFDLIVAKGVVAPVAAYQSVCREFIRVNTPGSTTADMSRLPYRRRRKPLFPLESID